MPNRSIRNKSSKIILFNQTRKDIEHVYKDVAGYVMRDDELKELCRKAWEEDCNYLFIDKSKEKEQERYCICNESKNTYIECTPETKPF